MSPRRQRLHQTVPGFFAGVITMGILAAAVQAQAPVVGSTTDAGTGEPLKGVLVALLGPGDEIVQRVLSNRHGEYRLIAPRPGDWRLRAELIGYRSAVSDPVQVGDATVHVPLRLAPAPIRIEALEIEQAAYQRCRRLGSGEASTLANLWYEAKKVLNVVALIEAERPYQYRLESRQRAVSIFNAGAEEDVMRSSRFFPEPFVTASLDSLLQHGWVQPGTAENESVYYGPDAATMLSEAFTEAYCFRIRPHPEMPDLVGIAFEPVRSDRLPDIRGVLWLERETATLRSLDFSYTQHLLEPALPRPMLPFFGGEVTFMKTEDAAWIVRDWTLRMPQYRQAYTETRIQPRTARPELAQPFRSIARDLPVGWLHLARASNFAVWEQGGSVLEILPADAPEARLLAARTAISGTVWDSTRALPLVGAVVAARRSGRSAVTDEQGHFELTLPEPGTVHLEFTHPRLDTLGVRTAGMRRVDIRRGEALTLQLAVPSFPTLRSGGCDRSAAWIAADQRTAMLRGRLSYGGREGRLGDVPVAARATFPDRLIDRVWEAQTDTDELGHFVLCNVPIDVPITVRTNGRGIAAEADPVTLSAGQVRVIDLPVRPGGSGVSPDRTAPDHMLPAESESVIRARSSVAGAHGLFVSRQCSSHGRRPRSTTLCR